MPINNTRSFVISGVTVVFSDGEQWSSDGEFISLKQVGNLNAQISNVEIVKQYQLGTNSRAKYVPIEDKGLWYCTCGTWNNQNKCTECSLTKTKVFETYDFEKLKKSMDIRIAEELEQKARIEEENELKKKKRKRDIKIAMCIMLLIAIIVALIAVQPYILRYKINDTIEKMEYFVALDYIEKVKDEQEASVMYERVVSCMYEDVLQAIDEHNYALGAELSRTYKEYIDFEECINLVQEICPHENTSVELIEATCEIDGCSIDRCDLCEYEEITVYEAIGHDFTETVNKEPTCDEDGNKHLICNNCGSEQDVAITKLGHMYEKSTSVKATCTKVGEYLYKCSKCGDEYTEEIKATGHTYEKSTSVKATCTKVGEYLYKCSQCGDKYTEEIKATGHNFTKPTCTEDGTCTKCGAKGESALGHDWKGVFLQCSRCSINYPANINIIGVPCTGELSGVTINEIRVSASSLVTHSKETDVYIYISGVKSNSKTSSIYVDIYDSSGNKVASDKIYLGTGTSFTEASGSVELKTDQTYTIKVSY